MNISIRYNNKKVSTSEKLINRFERYRNLLIISSVFIAVFTLKLIIEWLKTGESFVKLFVQFLIGEGVASALSINIEYMVYRRSDDESSKTYPPKVPFAVKHYLNNGLDPNEIFENRYTLLLPSSCCGDNKLVKLLIEYGANVNIKDVQGKTALYYAKESNFEEMIKILTKEKED